MRDATLRWLLLLGSSRDDDRLMRDALKQLGSSGTSSWVTPIQRFPADDDSGLVFYNALATWHPTDEETNVQTEIRRIESELGRDHSRRDEVAIDIDLLACFADEQWYAHAHAEEKREFDRPLVRTLLEQAGVVVTRGNR